MLLRISCHRCRLGSLWTDEPAAFLTTICRRPARCEATLHDERFHGDASDEPGADTDASVLPGAEPAA